MQYTMNAGIVDAVQQLQADGVKDAVPIYCGAPLAYEALWQPAPDYPYFKQLLSNAVKAGVRRGHSADEVIKTFCQLCFTDEALILPMLVDI